MILALRKLSRNLISLTSSSNPKWQSFSCLHQQNFPLRPVSEYTKATSEIGFTLAQIFDAILTVPGSTLTFDSVLDAITALRTKADCSLNISSIPRVNSFLQRKSNSRDSFFITHDSLNKEITQKQSSPMGGKKARPLPFVSSAGDQELPKEESAEFGGNHNDNDLISQKENNNIVTQTSYQTAFSPMERTQSEFPKDPPSIPHVRLAGVRNMRATTSERPISSGSRTSSTSTSGLLIDCGRAAVKKVLSTPQQAIQMLPCNVVIDNIKGMKLDGHALTDIAGLPRNLIVLNISNCQLSSLKLLSNICKNLKLLNAGFNSIHSLEGAIDLPSLTELYVNNNNLSSLNECGKMDRLRILDASANPLNNLEDIEELAFSRSLQFLQLRDTLVGSLPEYQLQIRALLPAVQVVEEMEAYKYSNFAKIASFALGSSSFAERYTEKAIHDISDKVKHTSEVSQSKIADETLGRVNDSKASKRSQKKDISNIMDQVSSKECTIVSQRNITDSISKSHAFNNPIAAMMIAPPQGLVGSRSKTQAKKKVFKRMTPISVPTSTKRNFISFNSMRNRHRPGPIHHVWQRKKGSSIDQVQTFKCQELRNDHQKLQGGSHTAPYGPFKAASNQKVLCRAHKA
eukprot:TRINITY_DN224_c0_g4_i3.p1 TRINITY_DN224_c0_g4~~TRINITY_DN224_c0_g4_i3.p1  ORF type:complete len:630 (-),score=23.93 TRINITY_DN224_c0_g4_i3:1009-2898(-)